jgi:uncharacterized protein YciI
MSLRYAFFYLMAHDPDRVRMAVPRHVSHWRGLALSGYTGGPFADRTGGLITFETDDPTAARAAVESDPFVEQGLLGSYWLKEWTPD